jgi:hypothetical protein
MHMHRIYSNAWRRNVHVRRRGVPAWTHQLSLIDVS